MIIADEFSSGVNPPFDPVSPQSAGEYEKARVCLVERVNSELDARTDLYDLIGENNRRLMYDNHENHVALMSVVFSLREYSLLDSAMPWVYRSYRAHGFSYAYFPVVLNAWIDAVYACLGRSAAEEISGVYRWMISRHDESVEMSRRPGTDGDTTDERWNAVKNSFFEGLMSGDAKKCLDIARKDSGGDTAGFFIHVIQPAMYKVGELWEKGEISVAREHLASALVSRVMTSLFVEDNESASGKRGKAVVSAACNEYHDIGAWMVADLLERKGWDVSYLGANTPASDVAEIVEKQEADICAVSVAMPFNLMEVRKLIEQIKKSGQIKKARVMVGGLAFSGSPELWRRLGADGYAANAAEAVELAERWWNAARAH